MGRLRILAAILCGAALSCGGPQGSPPMHPPSSGAAVTGTAQTGTGIAPHPGQRNTAPTTTGEPPSVEERERLLRRVNPVEVVPQGPANRVRPPNNAPTSPGTAPRPAAATPPRP